MIVRQAQRLLAKPKKQTIRLEWTITQWTSMLLLGHRALTTSAAHRFVCSACHSVRIPKLLQICAYKHRTEKNSCFVSAQPAHITRIAMRS